MLLYYADPATGGGKTYALIEYASAHPTTNFAVVMPTRVLIAETIARAVKDHPAMTRRIETITSDSLHTDPVGVRIQDFLLTVGENEGRILFITHEGFQRTPYWHNKQFWHVFIDEASMIETVFSQTFTLSENRKMLTSLIELVPFNEKYSGIRAVDEGQAQAIATNRHQDDVTALFSPLTSRLDRKAHTDLYLRTEQFNNFVNGNAQQIEIHGRLSPAIFDGFGSMTFLAANLKNSLCYLNMVNAGVEFRQHKGLQKFFKYETHTNGHLMEVLYFSASVFTKNGRGRKIEHNGRSMIALDLLCKAILNEFANKDDKGFLWLANADVDDHYLPGGTRLPNRPQGLDKLTKFSQCAVFAALNPSSGHNKFLADICGISNRQVRRARIGDITYQAAGRGSVRLTESNEKFTLIVADKDTAEDVIAMYPGATMRLLMDYDPTPPKTKATRTKRLGVSKTSTERNRAMRDRKKVAQLNHEGCDVLPIKISSVSASHEPIEASFSLTLFHSRDTATGTQVPQGVDFATMFDLLKERADVKKDSKEDVELFTPMWFSHGRKKANAVKAMGIVFDCDHAEITPEQFHALLPGLGMIAYSSFNHTPDDMRYRLLMPTTRWMTPDESEIVKREIIGKLECDGITKAQHGIDSSKLNAASMFHFPSKTEHGFLTQFSGQPLDPDVWLEDAQPLKEEYVYEVEPVDLTRLPERVERYCDYWLAHGTLKGEGHRQFWSLSKKLRNAGCTEYQVRSVLEDMAGYANNPKERRSEIDRLMRDLYLD
jgi:hypothetical protein